ncbi:MAG: 50S ribosomal protein L3 [Acidiferrobacteraceae bacterium]|nr:50S ribosomal protein L3 [Acidiferrobacteraceae bacterium]|tara:strand:+ start:1690 stop:2352 length:663 start_codon:yes stop_codon:yes gene_type:complete
MTLGLIGRKVGMTRIFGENGESTPVTVVEISPNRVTQVKTDESDGYSAVQVTTGSRRASRVTAPMKGHFAKAGTEAGEGCWEFRAEAETLSDYPTGSSLTVELFKEGQLVDVQGTTIGRGFAGVMRRHGFRGGRATHGNSKAHRKPGSIGQNQDPGRVFKGKKMAGHMGNVKRTQQNLKIYRIDSDRNLILIRGSIPGPRGRDVVIRHSIKMSTDSSKKG